MSAGLTMLPIAVLAFGIGCVMAALFVSAMGD